MYKKRKKHTITLLEVMITLVIAASLCLLFTFNIRGTIQDHKFKLYQERILSFMDYSHKLAIINQKDVFLIIEQKVNGVNFHFPNDVKKDIFITDITCTFNNQQIKTLSICYSSTGNNFPHGKIYFYDSHEHAFSRDI